MMIVSQLSLSHNTQTSTAPLMWYTTLLQSSHWCMWCSADIPRTNLQLLRGEGPWPSVSVTAGNNSHEAGNTENCCFNPAVQPTYWSCPCQPTVRSQAH